MGHSDGWFHELLQLQSSGNTAISQAGYKGNVKRARLVKLFHNKKMTDYEACGLIVLCFHNTRWQTMRLMAISYCAPPTHAWEP